MKKRNKTKAPRRLADRPTTRATPGQASVLPITADQRAAYEAWLEQREQEHEAWQREHNARLSRRPADMRRADYTLPREITEFLKTLMPPVSFSAEDQQHVSISKAFRIAYDAYLSGCKQGFIEGFLYGEDKARPGALKNRERLRQQNLEKLARLGIEDRNAKIIAEFDRLARQLPGKEQRYEQLARDYDLTTRQIGNIIRGSGQRR